MDYITADGNLFAQRNFRHDSSSDFNTCIIIDLLGRIIGTLNNDRWEQDAITYQVVSSTQHVEWVKAQKHYQADCDCMMGVFSLCYGKQVAVLQEREQRSHIAVEKYCTDETILSDKERPKYLINCDIGLADTDTDWHSPWVFREHPKTTASGQLPARVADKSRTMSLVFTSNHERASQKDEPPREKASLDTTSAKIRRQRKRPISISRVYQNSSSNTTDSPEPASGEPQKKRDKFIS